MGLLAEDAYEALGHFARKDESGDLLTFVEALLLGPEQVYEVVRDREDGRPGWAILFDVDQVGAQHLPFLAQFVGAQLTPQMDEAQQRAEVAAPTTWKRGQTETMRTALAATLTGTKRVVIRERTPEAHDLFVRVLAEECPKPDRTEALAYASKVAGLLLDFDVFEGLTYADLNASYETYGEVDETFADYDELLKSSLP